MKYTRRNFLFALPSLMVIAPSALHANSIPLDGIDISNKVSGAKIKISLNAYSFNKQLRSGYINLDELLEYCAELNFDAVDITDLLLSRLSPPTFR